MRVAWRAILASTSYYNRALEDYKKHCVFTYALLEGLRKTDYNKNLKIEIGDPADYTADQMLVTGKKQGYESSQCLIYRACRFQ